MQDLAWNKYNRRKHRFNHLLLICGSVITVIVGFTFFGSIITVGRISQTDHASMQQHDSKMPASKIHSDGIILKPEQKTYAFKGNNDDKVQYFFQLPGTTTIEGIVFLFHGCSHDGIDWFQLPEERRILLHLLPRGFAVVSISSKDRIKSRCWDTRHSHGRHSHDVDRIIGTLPLFIQDMQQFMKVSMSKLPLYAIGASSGGEFVTILQSNINFRGICVMISSGNAQAWKELRIKHLEGIKEAKNEYTTFPSIAFVYMPKDKKWAGKDQIQHVIDQYLTFSDRNVRVRMFSCDQISVTPSFLMERLGSSISLEDATTVVEHLANAPLTMMRASNVKGSTVKDSRDMILVKDPRTVWGDIEQILQSKIPADTLLIESMKELLNVAYAFHELTSEHINDVVDFWMDGG